MVVSRNLYRSLVVQMAFNQDRLLVRGDDCLVRMGVGVQGVTKVRVAWEEGFFRGTIWRVAYICVRIVASVRLLCDVWG